MPAPIMNGPATGMNHGETIKKLLLLERTPIKRMKKDNGKSKYRIKAWKATRGHVKKLSDKSKALYSFLGPFTLKTIQSSDAGAISGTASSRAQTGRQSVEVISLAKHHQFHSDTLENDAKLPAGKFEIKIGEKTYKFRFRGGKLSKLEQLLRSKGATDFEVFKIRVDSTKSLIGLRSRKSGKPGRIVFKDPGGVLRKIGLARFAGEKPVTKDIPFQSSALKAKGKGKTVPDMKIVSSGKSFVLKNQGRVSWKQELPKEGTLEFSVQADAPPVKKTPEPGKTESKKTEPSFRTKSESVRTGPDIGITVGDVKLKGYNITRSRKTKEKVEPKKAPVESKKTVKEPEFAFGVEIYWREKGKVKKRVILKKRAALASALPTKIKIGDYTSGRDGAGLNFFYEGPAGAKVKFGDVKLTQMGGGKTGELVAAHETSKAQDAHLKIQGVKVTRSSNRGLSDIIDGASLNLHRETKGPVILTVKSNTTEIVKRIRDWVDAYNSLMTFCRQNSKTGTVTPSSVRRGGQDGRTGVFAGDSTIRRLIYTLRTATAQSYPSTKKPEYRVLSEIGVSTGEVGMKNFNNNRYGLLKINENKLIEALELHPESVRELFGSDSNLDARVDNGVAFELGRQMHPYATFSRGLISVQIEMLKAKIDRNNDRIYKKELSLKTMERNLRQKFGNMESAIRRNRSTGKYLQQKLGGGGQ